MKQWIFRFGPAVIVMGIIFIVSSTPGSSIPDLGPLDHLSKKMGHLLGYALLGAAYRHAWSRNSFISRSGTVTAGLLVVLYAVIDEWHQGFIPGRNATLLDVCIDIVGGIIGIVLLPWLGKSARKSFGKKIPDRH